MRKKPAIVVYRRTAPKAEGPSCIDLFAGAGGLAVGYRQAGWAVLAANDSDEAASDTFRLNFPEASFFLGSIARVTAKALLKECGLRRGQLDCLIGGPPCQSFSYNNHQRSAEDERAKLFRDYLRLVRGLKPKTLVMENVPGILTIGDNSVLAEISKKLEQLGYDVFVQVLSAEEFGTPQIRRRVFILASRMGKAEHMLPAPSHKAATGVRRPTQLKKGAKQSRSASANPITVYEAIGDLPRLSNGGGKQTRALKKPAKNIFQRRVRQGAKALHNHVCHALTGSMIKRIQFVPEGGNWRDIPFKLLPAGMKRAEPNDHTKRYGRLSRRGFASTLLTKCDPHWGAYVHPTQNRTISVREAARLQGFPDKFVFAGDSLGKHYMQVGNAVPIPVAKAIGKSALKHLGTKIRRKVRTGRIARQKSKS